MTVGASRFASFGSLHTFFDDRFSYRRVFFQVGFEKLTERRTNDAVNFTIAQFSFGLTFELRLGNLD